MMWLLSPRAPIGAPLHRPTILGIDVGDAINPVDVNQMTSRGARWAG